MAKFSKFYIQLEQAFAPYEESDSLYLDAKVHTTPIEKIVSLIPCYNVEKHCEKVIRESLNFSGKIILIDDGSTDNTSTIVKKLAGEYPEKITLITFEKNKGKGYGLLEGFRYAFSNLDFEALVAIDSDSQHNPSDIPRLAQSILDGEDLVIGSRLFKLMPFKSRFANTLITLFLQKVFPNAPYDTQSGFRAFSKSLLKEIITHISGGHYEMEFNCLLLALSLKKRIRSLPIPTIYIDRNSSSHFRPIHDSIKIIKILLHYGSKKNRPK